MGKDKSCQRTKGNLQPSSSGRSAEVLGGVKGFIGFGCQTGFNVVPAASQSLVEDDSHLTPILRVALRKMSKKDSITKLKGLQEFEKLCSTEDMETIKACLAYWSRIYVKLSLDTDARVREHTQIAHAALVAKTGKNFAPFLRPIMPMWLMAMSDLHTPCSVTATSSFQKMFSVDKRSDVMLFCCKEILNFVSDNLFSQIPRIDTEKPSSSQDTDTKSVRYLFGSLQVLIKFLDTTSQLREKKQEIINQVTPIIENEKFWGLVQHENATVRRTWFITVKSLLEFDLEMVCPHAERLFKIIMRSLDSSDGASMQHVWSLFLVFIKCFKEFLLDREIVDSCFVRIFSVLKDGGRDYGKSLATLLCPILAAVSVHVPDKAKFYSEFCSSIVMGLSSDTQSKRLVRFDIDNSALISALFECLLYIIDQNFIDDEFWSHILFLEIKLVLYQAVSDSNFASYCTFFKEASKFLFKFYCLSETENTGVFNSKVKLREFLALIKSEYEIMITSNISSVKLSRLKCMFSCVKAPVIRDQVIEGTPLQNTISPTIEEVASVTSNPLSRETQELSKYWNFLKIEFSSFIKFTLSYYSKHQEIVILDLLAFLLECFSCDHLYYLLSGRTFEVSEVTSHESTSKSDTVSVEVGSPRVIFLQDVLEHLVREEVENENRTDLRISIFLTVYNELSNQEKYRVLSQFQASFSPYGLKCLIEKLLLKEDEAARAWLASSESSNFLLHLLEDLCFLLNSVDDQSKGVHCIQLKNLILFIFGYASQNYELFSFDCIEKMLSLLSKHTIVEEMVGGNIEEYMQFTVAAFNNFMQHSQISVSTGAISLTKRLFDFLTTLESSSSIRDDTMRDTESCLLSAVERWSEEVNIFEEDIIVKDTGLFYYIFSTTNIKMVDSACSFTLAQSTAKLLCKIIAIFVKNSLTPGKLSASVIHFSHAQLFLEILLPNESGWRDLESGLSSLYALEELFTGKIISRNLITYQSPFPLDVNFLRVSIFALEIIYFLTFLSFEENERSEQEGFKQVYVDNVESIDSSTLPHLAAIFHAFSYAKFILEWNELVTEDGGLLYEHYMGLKLLVDKSEKYFYSLEGVIETELSKILFAKSLNGYTGWSATLSRYLSCWSGYALALVSDLDATLPGYLETKQVLLSYVCVDELSEIIEEISRDMRKTSEDIYCQFEKLSFLACALNSLNLKSKQNSVINDRIDKSVDSIFQVLTIWRDSSEDVLMIESNVAKIKWKKVALLLSIVKTMRCLVIRHSHFLRQPHWDIIMCAITSWAQGIAHLSKFLGRNIPLTLLCCECYRLIAAVSGLFDKLDSEHWNAPSEIFSKIKDEWTNFFCPAILTSVMVVFIRCSNFYHSSRSLPQYFALKEISLAISAANRSSLLKVDFPPLHHDADEESLLKLPDNLQFLLNHLCQILLSHHWACQTAAYSVLRKVMKDVMTAWDESPQRFDDEEELPFRPLPYALRSCIEETSPSVEMYLKDSNFGSCYKVLSRSVEFRQTAAYLMAWHLFLLAIRESQHEDNQQLYSSYVREFELFGNLLNHLFHLMPPSTSYFPKLDHTRNRSMGYYDAFMVDHCYWQAIDSISFRLYFRCLTQLPAAVRAWWVNLDRSKQAIVDTYTSKHFSPDLISNEISTINKASCKFDNMVIKSRPGVREIIAVYTIDEASMELVLRLPPNYPLSTVALEDHKRVGVSISQWRNWLFGLNTMLSHRNTPLLSSLIFWKNNVDQKFKGIEECYICYYVLHGSNHQIPKLLCKTCKKKFHAACLFKWFNTSNNSTCPICRSLF